MPAARAQLLDGARVLGEAGVIDGHDGGVVRVAAVEVAQDENRGRRCRLGRGSCERHRCSSYPPAWGEDIHACVCGHPIVVAPPGRLHQSEDSGHVRNETEVRESTSGAACLQLVSIACIDTLWVISVGMVPEWRHNRGGPTMPAIAMIAADAAPALELVGDTLFANAQPVLEVVMLEAAPFAILVTDTAVYAVSLEAYEDTFSADPLAG